MRRRRWTGSKAVRDPSSLHGLEDGFRRGRDCWVLASSPRARDVAPRTYSTINNRVLYSFVWAESIFEAGARPAFESALFVQNWTLEPLRWVVRWWWSVALVNTIILRNVEGSAGRECLPVKRGLASQAGREPSHQTNVAADQRERAGLRRASFIGAALTRGLLQTIAVGRQAVKLVRRRSIRISSIPQRKCESFDRRWGVHRGL
jgi:hypothetical protein